MQLQYERKTIHEVGRPPSENNSPDWKARPAHDDLLLIASWSLQGHSTPITVQALTLAAVLQIKL
jgi:hypothetical protein